MNLTATFHTFTTVLFPRIGAQLDSLAATVTRIEEIRYNGRTGSDWLVTKRDEAEARYAEANAAARTQYFDFCDAVAAMA
jgi:hypothetical protein